MFWKIWELKKMYDKYKELQKSLKNLIIRGKEGKRTDSDWQEQDSIIVDITWEMKLKDLKINNESLLAPDQKQKLESLILTCFQKAQTKAQEVAAEKTKEILWFDPSDMANMMWGWWIPGLN